MIDINKPMRAKGTASPQEATVIALFGSEEAAEQFASSPMGRDLGSRQPGQLLAIALNGEPYGWYFTDGRFNERDPDSTADLENYEPPVIVKDRREVVFKPGADAGFKFTTRSPRANYGRPAAGIIEFTVAAGVLTNVEIVK
jgi:hypothetical protein